LEQATDWQKVHSKLVEPASHLAQIEDHQFVRMVARLAEFAVARSKRYELVAEARKMAAEVDHILRLRVVLAAVQYAPVSMQSLEEDDLEWYARMDGGDAMGV